MKKYLLIVGGLIVLSACSSEQSKVNKDNDSVEEVPSENPMYFVSL